MANAPAINASSGVKTGVQAVALARKWLNTPYQWGGGHSGPVPIGTPVDCSGLVNQVYGISGTTYTQVFKGSSVPNLQAALPGDLVFFGNALAPGEAYHVGIYIGGGQMIDAPHTGTTVRIDNVSGFGSIAAIRRLLPPNGGGSTTTGASAGTGTDAASGATYNYAQLEGLWIKAGGNQQYANMAAAIALAESGGNAQASNQNSNGSIDRGLWQINTVNGTASTFDVMGNARGAVKLSNGGSNWRPWCTAYSDGACGSKGGSYLGAGSPFLRYLQGTFAGVGPGGTPVAPDMNAPVNATAAAQNQNIVLTSAQQATLDAKNCNWIGISLNPGLCIGDAIGGALLHGQDPISAGEEAVGEAIATSVINTLVAGILNPFIMLFGGIIGVVGGGALIIFGMFLMVRESQTYQSAKGTAEQGAGMAAFFFGPEAEAGEAAAGGTTRVSSSRQMRIGRTSIRQGSVNTQTGRPRTRIVETRTKKDPDTGELIRLQTTRYTD